MTAEEYEGTAGPTLPAPHLEDPVRVLLIDYREGHEGGFTWRYNLLGGVTPTVQDLICQGTARP